ncbi:HipA domain-containing protein [Pinirhizobacter sp.]|jgi:serine/threonine-protein kinase HipA|uniref:type II toxin-antitoxin system HipA family toxin n=1 Tax=Pinirhizobacter sp. TaxID=2950432 RepID=UPI002F41B58D
MGDSQSVTLSLADLGQQIDEAIEGHLDEVSMELLMAGSSHQGARPKLMVDLDSTGASARVSQGKTVPGWDAWLIKFAGVDETRDAPNLEQMYMDLARMASIEVEDTKLMMVGKRIGFATRRYDRPPGSRVLCHTLGGLTHQSHRDAIDFDYAMVAQVMRRLAMHADHLAQGYRRAVFNAVMGVRDDHVKNFAFILDQNGEWRPTPAYDLTLTGGQNGYHTMTYAGSAAAEPAHTDLLRLAEAYGLEVTSATQIIEEVQDAVAGWEPIAKACEVSASSVKAVRDQFKRSHAAMKGS